MSLSVNIPRIDITPEAEEDDDNIFMNLSEELTDVEDLIDEDVIVSKKVNKKNKLKIKLSDNNSATDLEDFEASDDEQQIFTVKHKEPLSLRELDMEVPVTEESYQKQTKSVKGKRKMRTKSMSKQNNFYQTSDSGKSSQEETDIENYETENEIVEKFEEVDITLDSYQTKDVVSDNMVNASAYLSNCRKEPFQCTSGLDVPYVEQESLTDVEDFGDDEVNVQVKKHKKNRGRFKPSKDYQARNKENSSLLNDNCASKEKTKTSRHKRKLIKQTNTFPVESDNDEPVHFPFPVCKQIVKKNNYSLETPRNYVTILTDEEDMQSETDDEQNVIKPIDADTFEDLLQTVASGCSQVKEETNKLEHNKYYLTPVNAHSDMESGKELTNIDKFETESAENELTFNENSVSYKIKFSLLNSDLKNTNQSDTVKLSLPIAAVDPITDCESLLSSPEQEVRTLPLAIIQQQYITDVEDFSDNASVDESHLPDIELPPSVRNLMLIQENASVMPTIRILPLDSIAFPDDEDVEEENRHTDEESLSEYDDLLHLNPEGYINRSPTPDLPILEGGLINVIESVNNLKGSNLPLKECFTDSEELVMDTKRKRKRAPKFKYLHEKYSNIKNQLLPVSDNTVALTDTEDIYFSDNIKDDGQSTKGSNLTLPYSTENGGLTDTENIEISDDEKENTQVRPYSGTPQHMKELGGETVVSKEGSGPFCLTDKLELNRFQIRSNVFATPATTDSDNVSAEDDILNSFSRADTATPNNVHDELDETSFSRVQTELFGKFDPEAPEEIMYLKGGGYVEQQTDVEYLTDDKIRNDCGDKEQLNVYEKKGNIVLNLENGAVVFNCEERDASKDSTDSSEQKVLTVKDAAQQGEEQSQPSSSQQDSSRPTDTESIPEIPDKEKSKKVAHQHDLSEEMKELLKEMEKQSKK